MSPQDWVAEDLLDLAWAKRARAMYEQTVHPLVRRKAVVARELPPGTPEVIGEPVVRTAEAPPAAIAEAMRSDDPVVDPTQLGRRRRRASHARQYRLAQVFTALSMLATAGGIVCLLLGDRKIAWGVLGGAVVLAAFALKLSWRTRLAGRVLGYAWAATILAALAATVSVAVPGHWFDEGGEDVAGTRVQRVTPRAAG